MLPENKNQFRGDVLIIDDDIDVCETLKLHCEDMGCFRNILIATDGHLASFKLRNQKFGLILLDLDMPKKGGLEILREMDDTSLNSKDNIMIVSGTLNKELIEKITMYGVKSYLLKPFTVIDFQTNILKIISQKYIRVQSHSALTSRRFSKC